jgi:hypothetical protein
MNIHDPAHESVALAKQLALNNEINVQSTIELEKHIDTIGKSVIESAEIKNAVSCLFYFIK